MANVLTVVARVRAAKDRGDALAALLSEQAGVVRSHVDVKMIAVAFVVLGRDHGREAGTIGEIACERAQRGRRIRLR